MTVFSVGNHIWNNTVDTFTTNFGTVYNGDCLNVLKGINDNSINMCITDPPYLISYKTNHRKDKEHDFCTTIHGHNDLDLIEAAIKEIHRVLKDDSAFYCFCSPDRIDIFKQAIEQYFNIKNLIIWVKNNWTAGDLEAQFGKQYEILIYANKGRCKFKDDGKRISDVWYSDRVAGNEQIHQNQKPIDILSKAIILSSDKGDTILDCFFGSGSLGIACERTARDYIGIEIDKNEYKKSIERIDNENRQGKLFY